MEVTRAVASRTGWLAAAVLGPETLHRGPRLDQRAIDRDVLVREQPRHLRVSQDRAQEAMGDVAFQQPVAVLGEYRHVPHRRLDRQADEPAEEDVIRFPGNFGGFSRRLNVRFVFACRVGRGAKCCTASEVPWTDRSSVEEFAVHPAKSCRTKSAPGHAGTVASLGVRRQWPLAGMYR